LNSLIKSSIGLGISFEPSSPGLKFGSKTIFNFLKFGWSLKIRWAVCKDLLNGETTTIYKWGIASAAIFAASSHYFSPSLLKGASIKSISSSGFPIYL